MKKENKVSKNFIKLVNSQWKSAINDYPLIAISHLLNNEKHHQDLVQLKELVEPIIPSFEQSVQPKEDIIRLVVKELSSCFKRLGRDLGQASTDTDIEGAFSNFHKCISSIGKIND